MYIVLYLIINIQSLLVVLLVLKFKRRKKNVCHTIITAVTGIGAMQYTHIYIYNGVATKAFFLHS
ncbi:hypothetical protein DERF_010361 [Dermatophagoides farinae]|uniref:Uncharacterized protein n=1 Tax=Dermatophagoides farinae TaxID=6954 RepID=A0A922HY88_DERFA|nr:hypothetical protein DERF_010361 [Dermatophagoides farinae]